MAAQTALVVEDSMPLRRMLVKILEKQGCAVLEAENAEAGLKHLQDADTSQISVILLDLVMPVMDGFGFLKAARKRYGQSLPPVLICSSRSDKEVLAIVKQYGVAGYILKPFLTSTVATKVNEVLGRASPPAEKA